ncbi:nucleoporin Nup37-like [Artemia franciscana]|uniref:Nucleoporin Nup37 n=1 Tax=Artemia franciscana TaxID=6661 RepID=A0AA88HT40_ARTSF|nr:hypothetical protein QYM36_009449 [Artemia franciscana]
MLPLASPVYQILLENDCRCFNVSSIRDGKVILVIGSKNSVTCGILEAEEELESSLRFKFNILKSMNHPVPVNLIAISSATSLTELPRKIVFATVGTDKIIRIFQTGPTNEETGVVSDLKGHTDCINSISFDKMYGQYLASVSDDHTCRLWSTETGSCLSIYNLTSPGVAVCWHPEELVKFLVAQKNGKIRFYCCTSHKVLQTVDASDIAPVLSVDWDLKKKSRIVVGASSNAYEFDLQQSSRSLCNEKLHAENVAKIVLGSVGNFLASLGFPGPTVKVVKKDLSMETPADVMVGRSLQSHPTLPYVIIGSTRKLLFWKIPIEA